MLWAVGVPTNLPRRRSLCPCEPLCTGRSGKQAKNWASGESWTAACEYDRNSPTLAPQAVAVALQGLGLGLASYCAEGRVSVAHRSMPDGDQIAR